jgi:hypothetical protein
MPVAIDNALGATDSRVPPPLASETSVPSALAAGWYLADLYAMARAFTSGRSEDLPGACPVVPQANTTNGTELAYVRSPQEQWNLLVERLLAKVNQLAAGFKGANVLSGLTTTLEALTRSGEDLSKLFGGREAVGRIRQVHEDLQQALSASHIRLGKAYHLGRGLADTRRMDPRTQDGDLAERFGTRLITIFDSLADLASNLPGHSSRAVALSLTAWQTWAEAPTLDKHDAHLPNAAVWMALRRQGELWRSVLMGEKLGRDMLEPSDYANAGKTLVKRVLKSRPWVVAPSTVAIAGVAAGVYFVITAGSTVKAISAAGLSVLGAFGISATSIKATIGDVGKDLASQVWGADLDLAIGEAVTIAPGAWGIKFKKLTIRPPRGHDPHVASNAHHLTRLLTDLGARTRAKNRVLKHLHDGCRVLEDRAPTVTTKQDVADWLLVRAPLLRRPAQPVPGLAGRLLSAHRNGHPDGTYFVWTFDGGKVSKVDVHSSYNDALEAAGLLHID